MTEPTVENPEITVDIPSPYIETDGVSFTHSYPGASGLLYHTFRIAKIINQQTGRISAFLLIASTSQNDPRSDTFVPAESDTNMAVPMTESALYGLMQLLTSLRADMIPETSAMLASMFEHGHFHRH